MQGRQQKANKRPCTCTHFRNPGTSESRNSFVVLRSRISLLLSGFHASTSLKYFCSHLDGPPVSLDFWCCLGHILSAADSPIHGFGSQEQLNSPMLYHDGGVPSRPELTARVKIATIRFFRMHWTPCGPCSRIRRITIMWCSRIRHVFNLFTSTGVSRYDFHVQGTVAGLPKVIG